MKCRRGDVFLAQIVFTDGSATKKRPVAVLSGGSYNDRREEVIVAAITSNTIRRIFGNLPVKHWRDAGLLYPSTLTGILLTIKKDLLDRKLGCLHAEDLQRLDQSLRKTLDLPAG